MADLVRAQPQPAPRERTPFHLVTIARTRSTSSSCTARPQELEATAPRAAE